MSRHSWKLSVIIGDKRFLECFCLQTLKKLFTNLLAIQIHLQRQFNIVAVSALQTIMYTNSSCSVKFLSKKFIHLSPFVQYKIIQFCLLSTVAFTDSWSVKFACMAIPWSISLLTDTCWMLVMRFLCYGFYQHCNISPNI